MSYYFIRANGETAHSDPNTPDCFIPNEPFGYFNYLWDLNRYCFRKSLVRIGWPDVGEIRSAVSAVDGKGHNALTDCYDWSDLEGHQQDYLTSFSQILLGSIILVPDKSHKKHPNSFSGGVYIARTVGKYYYHHHLPDDPYECAHRIDVEWDYDEQGNPEIYLAQKLGLSVNHNGNMAGGFTTRAFYQILNGADDPHIIQCIHNQRSTRGHQ